MFVLIYIICFLIGFIFIGAAYQFWSAKRDQRIYPPLGEMIDIKNHRLLHVKRKKISEHGPSVILEAGNGLSSTSWMLVQPEIEKFANCLSYDRAGFGWSPQNLDDNTSSHSVEDLHDLLSKLDMPKPYILVGHSYGGLLNLLYAYRYPEEVAGIILVDAYHEEQLKVIPLPSSNMMRILKIASIFGIFRLVVNKLFPLPPTLPVAMRKRIQAEITCSTWISTMQDIFSHVEISLSPLKNLSILNKPMAVISAGLYSGPELKFKDRIRELQNDLVRKSSGGYQIIAENSSHNVPFSQPELIIATVKKMIVQLFGQVAIE